MVKVMVFDSDPVYYLEFLRAFFVSGEFLPPLSYRDWFS